MASERQLALAKTRSLKLTVINAMAELGLRSEKALERGEDGLSSQLSLQIVALGKQAAVLRRTEIRLLGEESLAGPIARLEDIASDARQSLARLKSAADALAETATLITILGRITGLFL